MIDRQARDKLASALRAYMDEQITAFELDEAINQASGDTDDQTVKDIGWALWLFYDDVKDHKIVASKSQWDWFSRLLLLLESDAEIEIVRAGRQWRLRQAIAAVCLLVFCALAVQTGFGSHLLIFTIPFGIISMALHGWDSWEHRERYANEATIVPFPSFASLLSVRRHVAGFHKCRYPKALVTRRIRGRLSGLAISLPWWAAWLMLAPLPLFFQMLPRAISEIEITLPESRTQASS